MFAACVPYLRELCYGNSVRNEGQEDYRNQKLGGAD